MKPITQLLTEIVSAAFHECGYDPALGSVGVSDRLDLCQFQCNGAFAAAKAAHKAPLAIAGEVAAKLEGNPTFEKVEALKPGFINLTLRDSWLAERAAALAEDAYCGIPQPEEPRTILVDYGGPNVAKPLHIGHLRSAIIGEALKRLCRAMGHRAIGDIHLGDWGLQIGLVITELQERYPEWECFAPGFDPAVQKVPQLDVDLLSEVYPCASARSKQDPEYAERAHQATFQLQNGRPGYIALWREIMRVSVADLKQNYSRLDVDFDLWYGESDADKYVPELLELLQKKELLVESEGAMVVEVAQEDDRAPMPPVIIKKSDDSVIYATTDLATLIQRERDYHPTDIWYVVDKRQGLHFTQVFRCAKKAGIVPQETNLEFLGFGTMNGPDGKPYKTRDGGVMRLSDLIKTVTEAAEEKLRSSEYVAKEDLEETSRRIGLAALKFGDLINHRSKDYIFDLDKFLSFEGKTGTYLLYTLTRIQSILKRSGEDGQTVGSVNGVYSDVERELILKLLTTGEVFEHALSEKAPNYLCEHAYQIASAFSRFYHENHILDESDPQKRISWLALCRLTSRMMVKLLDILGIEPVENM